MSVSKWKREKWIPLLLLLLIMPPSKRPVSCGLSYLLCCKLALVYLLFAVKPTLLMLLLLEPTAAVGAVVFSVMVVPVALPAPPPPPPPAPPAAKPESLPDDELMLGSSGESGCPAVAFDGVAVLALLFDFDSSACCDDAVEDDEG